MGSAGQALAQALLTFVISMYLKHTATHVQPNCLAQRFFVDITSGFASVARRTVAPDMPKSEEAWRLHLHANFPVLALYHFAVCYSFDATAAAAVPV